MSDIVELLRHTASKGISGWGDLQIQAANEIQVLRVERDNQADEIERLRAEVAGLREALQFIAGHDVSGADDRARAIICGLFIIKARAALAARKGTT